MRKTILAASTALCFMLPVTAALADITVYSAGPASLIEKLAAGFTTETGVKVNVFQATTGKVMARIEAEAFLEVFEATFAADRKSRAGHDDRRHLVVEFLLQDRADVDRSANKRDLVFLIGGAGSSFGRSHVMHLFYTEKTKRKVSFWYGARALRDNIYQKEYETIAKEFPNFTYNLVLSDPQPEDLAGGWPKDDPMKTNFLFRAFEIGQLRHMEAPEESLYYVCGPPLHNSSVLKLLDDYGVPRQSIVLDDFGS